MKKNILFLIVETPTIIFVSYIALSLLVNYLNNFKIVSESLSTQTIIQALILVVFLYSFWVFKLLIKLKRFSDLFEGKGSKKWAYYYFLLMFLVVTFLLFFYENSFISFL